MAENDRIENLRDFLIPTQKQFMVNGATHASIKKNKTSSLEKQLGFKGNEEKLWKIEASVVSVINGKPQGYAPLVHWEAGFLSLQEQPTRSLSKKEQS